MMDLKPQLQDALGDAYRIERELGGGGMSRLFLAIESSLNRPVVVKLLPPELTSDVTVARFKREIEMLSTLQHPHILPILAAGTRGGLMYYIMPYIAGESLRHRLARESPMPVDKSLVVLRDIADALELAHAAGVVHRDIKPENILLEGDHAVLTDFGIALAVAHARPSGRLTGAGTGIGTPGYMSPEQALGEIDVDPRTDVYGLAVVGYEMLAGRPPFTGPTAQAILAAHVRDTPATLQLIRPEVPKAVSDAIARALSKDPAARYPTAGGLRDALEGKPDALRQRARRRLGSRTAALAGVAALAVVAALFAWWRISRPPPAPPFDPDVVAVAPFQVLEPSLALWREGMVDILSRNLDGAGALRAVPPSVVIRRWSGHVDAASASALGRATRAQLVVYGSLLSSGPDSTRASASVVDAATASAIAEVSAADLSSRMDRLTDSLTLALIRALHRSAGATRLSSLGSTSLPAIKAFLEGEQFFRRVRWDSAAAAYGRALEADSGFALALMRQGDVAGWLGGPANEISQRLGALAGRNDRGLGPRESLLVASNALMDIALGSDRPYANARQANALAIAATQRYPDDPEVWHLLAEARMHFGAGGALEAPLPSVFDAEREAIALDSGYAPAYIHAIEIALGSGDVPLARQLLARFAVIAPSGPQADGMRLVATALDPATAWKPPMMRVLDTLNDFARSAAVSLAADLMDPDETAYRIARSRLQHLDRLPAATRQIALLEAADLAFGRGHARTADSLRQWWFATQLVRADAASIHYAELCLLGIAAAPDCRAGALAALASPPLLQVLRWQYLWAVTGEDTAVLRATIHTADSLARTDAKPKLREAHRYVVAVTEAHLLLARHDTAAALIAFAALSDTLCTTCLLERISRARLLAARGRAAEAATLLDRRVPDAIQVVAPSLVLLQLERGRIAERLRDDRAAVAAYSYVTRAWLHADPSLAPVVAEAHAGLARLGADRAATGNSSPR